MAAKSIKHLNYVMAKNDHLTDSAQTFVGLILTTHQGTITCVAYADFNSIKRHHTLRVLILSHAES